MSQYLYLVGSTSTDANGNFRVGELQVYSDDGFAKPVLHGTLKNRQDHIVFAHTGDNTSIPEKIEAALASAELSELLSKTRTSAELNRLKTDAHNVLRLLSAADANLQQCIRDMLLQNDADADVDTILEKYDLLTTVSILELTTSNAAALDLHTIGQQMFLVASAIHQLEPVIRTALPSEDTENAEIELAHALQQLRSAIRPASEPKPLTTTCAGLG